MSAEGQLSSAAPWPERWKGRAKPSISRLRQKNQVGLNSDTGAKGAKRRKTEASAAKPPRTFGGRRAVDGNSGWALRIYQNLKDSVGAS